MIQISFFNQTFSECFYKFILTNYILYNQYINDMISISKLDRSVDVSINMFCDKCF